LDPTYAAYFNRGLSCYEVGQFDQAIQDFGETIRLNPAHAEAYSGKGNAHHALNRYDLAIQNFNEVIRGDVSPERRARTP
jgi:tetratricopeptide (TPR) repeat protein